MRIDIDHRLHLSQVDQSGVNGGMMKRQSQQHKPVNYILVESVDEYSKKIETLGDRSIG